MDSRDYVLSLLGLALRGGRLAVGEEPVEAAARAKHARLLLLASDAADNTYRRTKHFAEAGNCIWLTIPFTKAEMGQAVGRSAVAIVAVTDIGLAAAVAHRLEALDEKKFGETAARLDVKAKRAEARRAEQRAHEKNVRTGKYKAKKAVPAAEAPAEQPVEVPQQKPQQPKARPAARRNAGEGERPFNRGSAAGRTAAKGSRPSKGNRPTKPRAKYDPYAHSRPVKKGKGSFKKKQG